MPHDTTAGITPSVRLGPLECRVMEALWQHAPVGVRGIIDALDDGHAYTTIATVLGNLERKELVAAERVGRSALYRALRSREEHAAMLMAQALENSGDQERCLAHLITEISPEARTALARLL